MINTINDKCPFGERFQKYWDRRYFLFSRFDKGIQVDREGLYSVKPEESSLEIGKLLFGKTVLDAFCGVGGSAIGFARAGKKVIAVEIDEKRLEMARHNAGIYGVKQQIIFYRGDCRDFIESEKFDSIYLDPPWRGIEYHQLEKFPLSGFEPDGQELLKQAFSHTNYVAITVPLNFEISEILQFQRNFKVLFEWFDNHPLYFTIFFF